MDFLGVLLIGGLVIVLVSLLLCILWLENDLAIKKLAEKIERNGRMIDRE